ncbi:MAG: hypothetical protein KDK40_04700, partial [Chlamydiia bacterium]|nr:hypothetical protein [Chlamydiia bacterium]
PNDSPFCLQGSAFLSEVDRLFTWLKMQLSNWKGLEFSSFGWIQLDQKSPEISEIRAQCTVNRYVDREQARTLLLKAAEEILKALNSDTRIKPYLAESPFPVSRLKIALLFRQNRVFVGPRADYEGGSIESVDLIDGLLTYYSYLPITPEEDRKERTVYAQESYEEARRQMDLPTNVDTRFQRVWRDVQYFFRSLCEQLIGIIFGLFVIFSALLFPLHA